MNAMYRLFRLFSQSSPKNSYYHENLQIKYRHLEMFTDILRNINISETNTQVNISYDSNIEFGNRIGKVIRGLGLPHQWVKPKLFTNYDILQYKSSIYKLRIHNELHFLDGRLVFFCNSFPYININHNNIVEILLREKYIPEHMDFKELTSFKIVDESKNFIYARNTGHLSINYMTGDKDMQEKLFQLSTYNSRRKDFKEMQLKKLILEKI